MFPMDEDVEKEECKSKGEKERERERGRLENKLITFPLLYIITILERKRRMNFLFLDFLKGVGGKQKERKRGRRRGKKEERKRREKKNSFPILHFHIFLSHPEIWRKKKPHTSHL